MRAHAGLRLAELAREDGDVHYAHSLLKDVCDTAEPVFAPRAAFTLGQLLTDIGDANDAGVAFALAAQLSNPATTPDVNLNLAARWASCGRITEAISQYTSVIDAVTNASDEWMREEATLAAVRLGDLLTEIGDVHHAEHSYRMALTSGDDDISPQATFRLAMLIRDMPSRHDELDALLEMTLTLDHPECSPNAALWLAARAAGRGDYVRASDLLELVIECQHPDYAPLALRGRDALLRNQTLKDLHEVLELDL